LEKSGTKIQLPREFGEVSYNSEKIDRLAASRLA
jgi:hypothetical protein